ncbi:L-lysine 6-transaminase precursor [Rhodococcus rhodochrous J3]|uniref:L-lysine-epsilon aminotransferase n=2 Tax=Rhodococcus rhodochrous TaxID=1829 RepID=A0AA46WST9_RHORH|nr:MULTISPECIES: L-lysine 6-transaminase [Rhodococcus]MBF4479722.1 L-lysine 6-transaminase [Rhodococcus rhodochrous]MCB8909350.1 L-lysine 6-transaminase [Rhodococcus rhodochrous]MCD2096850.1 L-lysine 6-transaminase [Rhodococcus rhodochrous]MCD2121619.1 L-lysine 6-transaminase [Rhodococcus rhodochrous]MCQ4137002.1 L-lysine 6-transaminase [Rhodococcus rhodochrous]
MSTAFRNPDGAENLAPDRVHSILGRHMLADGFDLVLDLDRSRGVRLVDARDGTTWLDMFGFFASSTLGMNHPALTDPEAAHELAAVAANKPSNSDIYTVPMARFVETFVRVLGDPALPHLFFVDGGGLAVENALKVAFDWKSRLNESRGLPAHLGGSVLHLTEAFHGRTGYTLSLTNTDPVKTDRFPKFDWPRIDAPYLAEGRDVAAAEEKALEQARRAFAERPHDIACFIAEPIQGEGGDHHFRPEFFRAIAQLCRENDALMIFDEVQTGAGTTGTAWAYQQLGVTPDIVAFGKKTQVCGIMAGERIDEVPDNVFAVSSRINSTWGGNLTDMVRARRILEVVEHDRLIDRARLSGAHLLSGLQQIAARRPVVTEPRGRGLMCAVDLPTPEIRDEVLRRLYRDEHVLVIGTGTRGIRFRPPLIVTTHELDEALDALDRVTSQYE